MKNVCLNMDVYLITVDDLERGMTYHVRATKTAARNLFEKIVKENYFDLVEDTKEDLKEAITLGCWESKRGDVVKFSKCNAFCEGENLVITK